MQGEYSAIQWEYSIVEFPINVGLVARKLDVRKLRETLNEKGALGWELTTSVPEVHIQPTAIIFVFKRPTGGLI